MGLTLGALVMWRISRNSAVPDTTSVVAIPSHAEEPAPRVPAPTNTTTQPQRTTVSITFNTQPPRAEIYSDDRLLGIAPGPISIARADTEMQVVVKSAGFVPATVVVKPTANQEVKVVLTARAARPTKSGVSRDLENPY
jgi:hypothetical protein